MNRALVPDLRRLATALVLACLTALPGAALAAAGHIQFVKGEVRIVGADRRERPAKKGDALEERDAVITGAQSFAQLRMIDEGLISMRPDTHLRIDTYRYAGREDGTERGVLGLVKGGFRTLTGVIGRANKSNYTVRTPNATIGIRGTDHEPFYIPPPLPGEFPLGPPGTYNRVNVGETYIEVGGVRFELGPNEVGFAAFAGGLPPVRLDRLPGFMRATLVQQSRDVQRAVRALSTADTGGATSGTAPSALESLLALLFTQPVLETRTATGASLTALGQPLPDGFAYTSGDRSVDAGGNVVVGSGALITGIGGSSVVLGSDGRPSTSAAPFGVQYLRGEAPLVSGGSDTFSDIGGQQVSINWGVYAGGSLVDSFGARVVQGLHFAFAPATPAAIQATLSGTYSSLVSIPPLITEGGIVG
ncbi:MAG: FecR family protein, partial [Proteobacteria bacterium]|nr:FecR family protein [Pseudomonadota bacterium]